MKWVAQIIGLCAIIFWLLSIDKKEKYQILKFQFIANAFYSIQYLLLGVISASFMNLTSSLRCLNFMYLEKNKKKPSKTSIFIFCILVVVFGIYSFNGYLTLIPIIITLFYTISTAMKGSKWIRYIVLLNAFIWIYYNFTVGAYVTIIGNILEIILSIKSIKKYKKKEV